MKNHVQWGNIYLRLRILTIQSFSVVDENNTPLTHTDFLKGKYVLFFYPKDNTPGCTKESCDFRDMNKAFLDLGFKVFGVSKDAVQSHIKFKDKFQLSFPLISDVNLEMCQAFGVYQEKKFMGKTFMGIVRSTFVLVDGQIIREYRNVSVTDHVKTVLRDLSAI